MTVPEYRALAQKAALRVGPAYLRVFLIYTAFSAVLLYFSLRMQQRFMLWQETVQQFLVAGDPDLPPLTWEVLSYMGLALVLLLLAQVLKAGWYEITLRGVRGLPWHLLFHLVQQDRRGSDPGGCHADPHRRDLPHHPRPDPGLEPGAGVRRPAPGRV